MHLVSVCFLLMTHMHVCSHFPRCIIIFCVSSSPSFTRLHIAQNGNLQVGVHGYLERNLQDILRLYQKESLCVLENDVAGHCEQSPRCHSGQELSIHILYRPRRLTDCFFTVGR